MENIGGVRAEGDEWWAGVMKGRKNAGTSGWGYWGHHSDKRFGGAAEANRGGGKVDYCGVLGT